MKKIFSIFLCAAFVFALSANLFAGWFEYDQFIDNSKTVNIDFRPSKDVSVYYDADQRVNYQDYIAGTKHTGGDTVYGAASGDTSIYKIQQSGLRGVEGADVEVDFPNFLPPEDNESIDWETAGWGKL